MADELNYGRKFWWRSDEREGVAELGRAKDREEPSGKRADNENRAASAAPVTGRKPDDASVSPPLKARKFQKFVDEVPRGGDGTEHLLKIPEAAVRKVLGGSDRGYDLQDGTPNELEMRIG